jgi:hypothetical protein
MTKDTTYKGYRLRVNPLAGGVIWVERDGMFIGYAPTEAAARAIVDLLTAEG